MYSPPIQELLVESSNTLWACRYCGNNDLRVVDLSCITACVSMQPLPPAPSLSSSDTDCEPNHGLWFVVEKSGLEDAQLTGFEEHTDGE